MDPTLNKISSFHPNKAKNTQNPDLKFKKKIATCLRNLELLSSSPDLKPSMAASGIKEVKAFI